MIREKTDPTQSQRYYTAMSPSKIMEKLDKEKLDADVETIIRNMRFIVSKEEFNRGGEQ